MKRVILFIAWAFLSICSYAQKPSDTPQSQMEKLDRGLVVIKYTGGYFVSWRLLGTDDENTSFEILRNGTSLKKDIYKTTSVSFSSGSVDDAYQVVTYQNGTAIETSPEVKPYNAYLQVKLDKPSTGALGGTYSPNDCSVGDVDGDGQYEVFVKWDPSNSKDNSQNDKTDNV